jgi:hypothetical protein
MPTTREQRELTAARNMRNSRRAVPQPSIFTRRTLSVVGGDTETEKRTNGYAAHCQRIVSVKSGSARMRREFFRQCERLSVAWEHIGTDDNAESKYDREGHDRELNHNVQTEFLVWGTMDNLDTLCRVASGDGKPIASDRDVVAVRVVSASGSGPMSGSCADRVKLMLRGKIEREARELRQELNRVPVTSKQSIYNADVVATHRGKVERALPRIVDVNDESVSADTLKFWFEALSDFMRLENREPMSADELRNWILAK